MPGELFVEYHSEEHSCRQLNCGTIYMSFKSFRFTSVLEWVYDMLIPRSRYQLAAQSILADEGTAVMMAAYGDVGPGE